MSTPPAKRATATESAWKADALCRDLTPALFFVDGISNIQRDEQRTDAKAVCAQCPVEHQCLEHAVEFGEKWGVWGGVDMEQHGAMRTARRVIAKRQAIAELAESA